ncbi:hypothetical protein CsatB_005002 [Cannabis sativa]|uniref:uncharacterized protein LOC115703111 n=1 Tax=Cannabis sativa TaxID=3483 RepID=UPI0029CAA8AA|nr:uncharacterized protein LOC115703111 [Cannabis sativa]
MPKIGIFFLAPLVFYCTFTSLLSSALLVRAVIGKRFHIEDTSCPLCGLSEESFEHLFLSCDVEFHFWRSSPWSIFPVCDTCICVWDWIKFICDLNNRGVRVDDVFFYASIVVDTIWRVHNEKVHNNCPPDLKKCIDNICISYADLHASLLPSPTPVLKEAWFPSLPDWIKLNCDVKVGFDSMCIAVVVRNHFGRVIRVQTAREDFSDVLCGEAAACCLAVSVALDISSKFVIVENDSMVVINAINGKDSRWALENYISFCTKSSPSFISCNFSYISRTCNFAAHNVARWAFAHQMRKPATIDTFFKRKNSEASTSNVSSISPVDIDHVNFENRSAKSLRLDIKEGFDINSLVRDLGIRPPIWEYPPEKRDEVRRAYIKAGPYQIILSSYQKSEKVHSRSFQSSWFKLFPSWLEYSPKVNAAFCLPCFLFHAKDGTSGLDAFTINGFRSWNKVRGKNCAFVAHIRKDINSPHRNAEKALADLMNQPSHVARRFANFTSQEIAENRLRLKTLIEGIRWLAFQACPFRGHDESKTSINRGNFLELLSFISSYNDKVVEVLDKAPRNATYTSPTTQKQVSHVLGNKVRNAIREEIGDANFSIIVDEARDESKKEQMSIVLRFVDKDGCVQERFFGLIHVKDTAALTLKQGIFSILSNRSLDVHSIRGQGYDGASNMRGQWNGLQALISNECPYAYYVHCFAHRLQLALVAASREVIPLHQFVIKLNSIVYIVSASCKRNDQLRIAQAANVAHLLEMDELESGKWLNQIGSLQRAGDARWSSHLKSISSLIKMFSATCEVLLNIIEDGTTFAQRGDADATYEAATSFEFVFILHLMKKILEISNILCQALQLQSQDILNAMHLVSSTKILIQKLREDGWNELVDEVKSFCEPINILVPNFNAHYTARRGRARGQQGVITVEHYYRVDIFNAVVDFQLQELNNKFNDNTVELLILSSALDPREMRVSLRVDDICKLVQKFYPRDFTEYEMIHLRTQFEHFDHVRNIPDFIVLTTISDLCQWLVKTRKAEVFPLVYRVVTLILTLPVSTNTTERSFSAMNLVKTTLRNKMEDEFLSDCLLVYIEREIAEKFSIDPIIDNFRDMQERRSIF